MVKYSELEKAIESIAKIDSVSFLHGWMTGLITYSYIDSKELDTDWFFIKFVEEYEVKPRQKLKFLLTDLLEQTLEELDSETFSTYMLLIDNYDVIKSSKKIDNKALALSLTQWVTGFIYITGSILGSAYSPQKTLPDDLQEIISNLSQISALDINSVTQDEAAQLNVIEMIEFVKICIQNLRQDFLISCGDKVH